MPTVGRVRRRVDREPAVRSGRGRSRRPSGSPARCCRRARSGSGPEAVDQVTLVRRLRGLGLGLPAITDVLGGQRSVSEAVRAARAELDVELAAMAWRRASLVAVEQAAPAERAARLDLLAAAED